ncbi:carbohydrate ABC transporter permease [Paenibacillus elgii]|uniref:Carbohydrate ABC transporter permease n=1 Tax=Paenibacillus elgii TaxID=189691 RepID=A0A2T6G5J5_9BACL|nr:carbohydrate ABC transporter permease [Paenibacillus elgii]MCM3269543.1 carbohydrate ABC transporter permease [Paenibacillus elgii]NEN86894.1 carbohydrate ABC transporter permease [Paenibacillus elgii]PUA39437.1 carbohydrate ABC transporter permease [Paenibacillus elgii]
MIRNRTWQEKALGAVNGVLLVIIALLMLFPFYYMTIVSFTSYSEYVKTELLLVPTSFVLDAYAYIFQSDSFVRSLGVTIFVTVVGTFVNLLLTSMMAYALSRNILGKRVFLFLVLFTFVFGAGIIPTYMIVSATGLINSYWALILPVAINSYNLIVMRQFFLNIPHELTESALIDGANDLQIYARIILPLSKPALAAFGLFSAVAHWNTYFSALLYLNDPAKWTVQVMLRQIVILSQAGNILSEGVQAARGLQVPPAETIGMAAILVSTIPILVLYPFLQKHFAKGVMLGSVKG